MAEKMKKSNLSIMKIKYAEMINSCMSDYNELLYDNAVRMFLIKL